MSGRDRDKFRKYLSGSQKEKKRQKREQFVASQKGAFEKFLQPQTPSTTNLSGESSVDLEGSLLNSASTSNISSDECKDDLITVVDLPFLSPSVSSSNSGKDTNIVETVGLPVLPLPSTSADLNDPGTWPKVITASMVEEIIRNGPVREVNYEYPTNYKNNIPRRFSTGFYIKTLPNGEKVDRKWLVYSKKTNRLFCFCCKLFAGDEHASGKLSNTGFCDWKHLGNRLKEHEQSTNHASCLEKWVECETRIFNRCTINQHQLSLMESEKKRWRDVLKRIVLAIKYLAVHNIAFRGSNDVLYKENNGNFLGLIQMIAEFDPIMEEHLRRIKNKETHCHYLGNIVQNEIINLMALQVTNNIVETTKTAKYYAVMLDCTPDAGHKEQMSVIIRYVNITNEIVTVEEHFIQFLNILSSTGENLYECLLSLLNNLGLDPADCRGQSYDNCSNMKGAKKGVQARILNLNPRAFFMPCASHSLNLLLCDAAKSTPRAVTFFGVIGRLFSLFSASTQRWDILLQHVPNLTLKKLSDTRWESRVESVKVLRYQSREIRDALLEVHRTTDVAETKSEAYSLAVYELENYEFILSVAIWYDILFSCNAVSKTLQGEDMDLQVATNSLSGLKNFLQKFRETGFVSSRITANELAESLDIEVKFKKLRTRKKRKLFDYEAVDDVIANEELSAEDKFKVEYFYPIVDTMLARVDERFSQFETFSKLFGFLYKPKCLRELSDEELKTNCKLLEQALSVTENEHVSKDIDGSELLTEINVFREMITSEIESAVPNPIKMLEYLNKLKNPFPNLQIVYRVLLTIPITVASAERSFSRLKLIKTYMRTTMTQERLSSLATLSIERDIVAQMDFDNIVRDFSEKKSRKVNFL